MKKIFAFMFLLLLPFYFSACSVDVVVQASQKANTYQIVATLDNENKTITATQTLEYINDGDSELQFVAFHLHPNAFSEGATTNYAVSPTQESRAYENGKSYGGIEILGVKENNQEGTFAIEGVDKHLLKVDLSNKLYPNNKVEIEISFVLTLPNINHRFGYNKHTINLGNWYPTVCVLEDGEWHTEGYLPSGDPFFTEVSNYIVTLTYASDLLMVSTGEMQKSLTKDEMTTTTYKAFAVRDFAIVLSSDFKVLSEKVQGKIVNYYYYDDENAASHLKASVDAFNTFSDMIGEYPYSILNVVKVGFLHGGMEYPNLVYISDQVSNESEYNNVIVHEIAHQWWYGVVGNNQLKDAWIDEGLAEYCTALFYDLNEGYGNSTDQVIGNVLSSYLLFCDAYREIYSTLDTSMNRGVASFNTETEYVYLTYVKGLLMFDSISEVIGQARMNKCLKALYKEFAMKEVTPNELIECFQKASGRNIKNFINSWLDGSVVLEELGG